MHAEILVLRLVHILGAVFWVGATLFTTFFLLPAMGTAGAAAGPVMAGLQQRRFMVWLPVAAVLTLLSGVRLLAIVSGGFEGSYFHTATGHTFAVSGAIAIVAFVLGFTIVRPAAVAAGRIGAQLATADAEARAALGGELDRVRARAASWGLVVAILLLLAGAGMAIARYLG